jgi:hypothetical protein
MTTKSSLPGKRIDLMGAAKCTQCGDSIDSGEFRVVATMFEIKPADDDEGLPARRGFSLLRTYCDTCIAEMRTIEIENPWKTFSDSMADPSAGPADEDSSYRGKPLAADYASDLVPAGSKIANASAEPSIATKRDPISQQKEKLSGFLNDPASRGMRPTIRNAARQWVEGPSQSEIARKLGTDQSTVSRMINGALKLADAKR